MPHKKKILVIEDDRLFAEIYSTAFAEAGFEVVASHDGDEGLRALERERPDIVLLDLMLPKLSGLEVLARLRAHGDEGLSKVPVLVLTNVNEHAYAAELKKHGVHGFFLKSDVTISKVLAKIKEVLG